MTAPNDLLPRIDSIWTEVSSRADALSDEQLSTPRDDRRPQDVLAHYARWLDWHRDAIGERVAEGSRRSYRGFNEWNAGWAAADASLTAAECRARLGDAFASFRRRLDALADDQWDEVVMAFAQQPTLNHMPEHLHELTAASVAG